MIVCWPQKATIPVMAFSRSTLETVTYLINMDKVGQIKTTTMQLFVNQFIST